MLKCLSRLEIPDNLLFCKWNKNRFFYKHTHDFWEFILISKGKYRQSINHVENIYQPNEAILLRPQDVHQIFEGSKDDTHLKIVIHCDFMKSVCDALDPNFYNKLLQAKSIEKILISDSNIRRIARIVSRIALCETRQSEDVLPIKRLLLSFVINLLYIEINIPKQNYPKIVQTLIDEISSPQNSMLNASELVKKLNYSYSYSERIFKQSTGLTINQFILNTKMNHAKEILLQTNLPIIDISYELGFSSLSYFMKLFKNTFGVSPGLMRKQYRNN